MYPEFAQVYSLMMSMPFRFGFYPNRGQSSIHVMIEKIKGRLLINKLRIIQLVEADLTAALKINIGRQLM